MAKTLHRVFILGIFGDFDTGLPVKEISLRLYGFLWAAKPALD
nr:MAG TPA: hypothetical protein [Caudoviricetes sp.]